MVFELCRVCADLQAHGAALRRSFLQLARGSLCARHRRTQAWQFSVLRRHGCAPGASQTCCISAICSRQKAASCSFCADMVAIFSSMFCGKLPACSCGTGKAL